ALQLSGNNCIFLKSRASARFQKAHAAKWQHFGNIGYYSRIRANWFFSQFALFLLYLVLWCRLIT
ncbi:MAG TPA: hypothetical protein DCG49_08695, partial [Ruminococcus sp.]|nr:hypothetical protein [Ruminococcus sp.]